MKHFVLAAVTAMLAMLLPFSCLAGDDPGSNKLRFTAIIPLTGDGAALGAAFRNGIEMALEKLPPATRSRIVISYEDDAFSPKNAVSAFNKVMNTGGTDVLLNAGSGTGNALAPLAEQHGVTFIAIASDKAVCQGRKYVFNFWVTPEEEARVAVAEAHRLGYKRIARIGSLHQGTLAVKSGFDEFNAGRIKVVLDEDFALEERDFRTFIARLRQFSDIDAVMVLLLPGQCGVFAKQLREGGVHHKLFGIEVFEDQNEVKASQGALVGQWYVNADEPDEHFAREYKRRFPGASRWGALNAHDAVLLAGAALERGYRPRDVHLFLEQLKDFKGALGIYSATPDHRFSLPATVKIVTENGFEKLRP